MIGNLAKLSNVRGVASGTEAASVTVKVDESGPVTRANQAKPDSPSPTPMLEFSAHRLDQVKRNAKNNSADKRAWFAYLIVKGET